MPRKAREGRAPKAAAMSSVTGISTTTSMDLQRGQSLLQAEWTKGQFFRPIMAVDSG